MTKNREQRGNEEAGPYRRLTAHPRLTSVTHVGPLFPTSVGFSLRSSPPYVGCEGTEPPAGGWGYEARSRREGKRNVGPLTLLSGRLSLRLRLSVVPPSRCAGDDEKRGKEWSEMLNSLVIYLYLLFSSFYIYWYSFCYLHVLIIISSHIFYCSFLIFSMSFITSSSNKYRILIFFQLHFIFLIFAIIFYLHITSFIICIFWNYFSILISSNLW